MPRTSDNNWDDDEPSWDEEDDDYTVPCPFCKRPIHEDAQRCPYCEHYISEKTPHRGGNRGGSSPERWFACT